jgi:Na+-driven multidrug efflux pump
MQFSAAIFSAALTAMKWLFGLTAILLVMLTATQWLRGDADARPAMTLSLAAGFVVLSILSHFSVRKLEEALRDGED